MLLLSQIQVVSGVAHFPAHPGGDLTPTQELAQGSSTDRR